MLVPAEWRPKGASRCTWGPRSGGSWSRQSTRTTPCSGGCSTRLRASTGTRGTARFFSPATSTCSAECWQRWTAEAVTVMMMRLREVAAVLMEESAAEGCERTGRCGRAGQRAASSCRVADTAASVRGDPSRLSLISQVVAACFC